MTKNITELELVNEEKISVIIPVFNVEKYLKQTLDSVIGQTHKNLEIICINDGSTDNSEKILDLYSKKDSRIKVFYQHNKGPSSARNRGLEEATGKYISFVDADDCLSYNAYEILNEVAEKNKLDLIFFGAVTFSDDIIDIDPWILDKINTKYKVYNSSEVMKALFYEKSSRPFIWMHFIKRSILETPNPIRFNEEIHIGEDQLLQFQYIPRSKSIMVIEDKLYHYRVSRKDSLMQLFRNKKIEKVKSHITLVEEVIRQWKIEGYFETEIDNLANWTVDFLYWTIEGLPKYFKTDYSKIIISIMESNGFYEYLLEPVKREYYNIILSSASEIHNSFEEIDVLNDLIANDKYEIEEIQKSRAFKLGRALTKKSQRLMLD